MTLETVTTAAMIFPGPEPRGGAWGKNYIFLQVVSCPTPFGDNSDTLAGFGIEQVNGIWRHLQL